jgi:hypothetical protein
MIENADKNELLVKLIIDEFGAKKVVVCPHEMVLNPGPVCWRRDLSGKEEPIPFAFKTVVFDEPSVEVVATKNEICATHDAQMAVYTYVLIVESEGVTYDTFQPVCEEPSSNELIGVKGRKPVIRPK